MTQLKQIGGDIQKEHKEIIEQTDMYINIIHSYDHQGPAVEVILHYIVLEDQYTDEVFTDLDNIKVDVANEIKKIQSFKETKERGCNDGKNNSN